MEKSAEINRETLQELLAQAEPGRLDRADTRPITEDRWDGESWKGVSEVNGKHHQPRIRVYGGRSFGCNCLDHQKLQGAKGPCKHVLSLALKALKKLRRK